MPYIPVVTEFEYINSGPRTLPTGETIEYEYRAPAGFALVSWGYTSMDPTCFIQGASITPDSTGPRFLATVQNTDVVNHSVRWTFVLVKV